MALVDLKKCVGSLFSLRTTHAVFFCALWQSTKIQAQIFDWLVKEASARMNDDLKTNDAARRRIQDSSNESIRKFELHDA